LRMTTNHPDWVISVIGRNAAAFISCVRGIEFLEWPIERLVIGWIVSGRENRALHLIGCFFMVHIKTGLCIAAFVAAVTSSNIVCLLCDGGIEEVLSFWKAVFHWLDHNSPISHLTFPAHSVKVIIIGHFVCDMQDCVEILHSQLDCVDSPRITCLMQSLAIALREILPSAFLSADSQSRSIRLRDPPHNNGRPNRSSHLSMCNWCICRTVRVGGFHWRSIFRATGDRRLCIWKNELDPFLAAVVARNDQWLRVC
jgi:hypothetical protein